MDKDDGGPALSKKEFKWLGRISAASRSSGMYPGERCEFVPNKVGRSLERRGLIELFIPHNPVHKERFVVTDLGAMLLARTQSEDEE